MGGQVGLQLSKCCSVGEDVDTNYLRYAIENIIDKPKTEVSIYCNGPNLMVERAYVRPCTACIPCMHADVLRVVS